MSTVCRGCLNKYAGHTPDETGLYCELCGTKNFYKEIEMDNTKLHEEKQAEFNELVKPLIRFMAQEVHPHHTLIITATDAELLEGEMIFKTKEYLVD